MEKIRALEQTIKYATARMLEADGRMLDADILQLALICNGCGAANAKIDFVPDSIWGLYIGYACMIHDFDYYMGKTEADRRFADERFKRNLLTIISWGNKAMWPARRIRVNTYYNLVRACGEAPFWSGKEINLVTLGIY